MKVHILSAFPEAPVDRNNFQARWLRESAGMDPFGVHHLCATPEEADLVLFVENHPHHDPLFLNVARHPVWKAHRRKAFLYHDADYAYPFLPGIYPSLLKRHHSPGRCTGAHYIGRVEENQAVRHTPLPESPRYLFSFVGSKNHPVRKEILRLKHPRARLEDTTGQNAWSLSREERAQYEARYGQALAETVFVLCPAGLGPSTYRLFETLEAGRIPVILSDKWVPPAGVPWETCSLRVRESKVKSLPELLSQIPRERIQTMATAARQIWEDHFSKPVSFHRIVEWCAQIAAARERDDVSSGMVHLAQLLRTKPALLFRLARRTRLTPSVAA